MDGAPLDHHLHPLTPDEMAERARDIADGAVDAMLVAVGQYSPDPSACERVLVLALKGQEGDTPGGRGRETQVDAARDLQTTRATVVLADGWMSSGGTDALCAHLADLAPRRGECDAMYATPWRCAWTADGREMEVWDESGRLLWRDAHGVHLRGTMAPLHVQGVHAFLGDGWFRRGVALRLTDGTKKELVAVDEVSAIIDPTYDGLDLLADASWVVALARAIGHGIGVPVRFDAALRLP